jgi:hypothetical protein
VLDASVVVVSTAISSDNPEIVAAREARIPVIRRAEMLGRADAFSSRHRCGRYARQDHDHGHGVEHLCRGRIWIRPL